MPDAPRLVAGRYRLLAALGEGGMGRVWQAHDQVLHREVAIKEVVFPAGLTDAERDELHLRTLREARAAARLSHPNVVQIHDVLQAEGESWIVMEYVPARSLQQVVLDAGPLPPDLVALVGLSVLSALDAAHRKGVLHRDVKPSNVLIAVDGRVVLTDFGLATLQDVEGGVTQSGIVLGSPQYIAPERARDGTSSVEADLWSLGATLYAAVEGQTPFARASTVATLTALVTEPPDPTRRAGPLVPLLEGLLRKDPRARPNAVEARQLLRHIVETTARRQRRVWRRPWSRRAQDGQVTGVAALRAVATRPQRASGRAEPVPYVPVPGAPSPAVPDTAGPGAVGPDGIPIAAVGGVTTSRVGGAVAVGRARPDGRGRAGGRRRADGRRRPDRRERANGRGRPGPGPIVEQRPIRSLRWIATAGVLVAVLLGVSLLVSGLPADEPGPAQPPPGIPSPMEEYTLPDGWMWYEDPSGFRVAAPKGWVTERDAKTIYFREPEGGARMLAIGSWQPSSDDPVIALIHQEASASRLPDYQRVRISAVPQFYRTCADWEYSHADASGRLRTIERGFTVNDGAAYEIVWRTRATDWPANQDHFWLVVASFRAA